MVTRARLAGLLVVALVALTTACGGGSGTSSSAKPRSTAPPATTTSPVTNGQSDGPTAFGTAIQITATGFQPKLLIAPMGQPVTWKNVSSSTQSVHFDNYGQTVYSGAIKPGGTWSFNPNAQLSITYHSTYDRKFHGVLQVQLVGNQ